MDKPLIQLGTVQLGTVALGKLATSLPKSFNKTKVEVGGRDFSQPTVARLPFEIYAFGKDLKAAAGTIHTDAYGVSTVTAPADGTWYFEGLATIDTGTGAITFTDVQWVTSPSSNTSSTSYMLFGQIEVSGGFPQLATLEQFNYGPASVFVHGEVSDVWGVTLV